jgi:centrin-1
MKPNTTVSKSVVTTKVTTSKTSSSNANPGSRTVVTTTKTSSSSSNTKPVSKTVVSTTKTSSSSAKPASKTVVTSTTTKTSSTSNTKPVVKTVVSTSKTSSTSNTKPTTNRTVVTSTTTNTTSGRSNTKPVQKTAVVTSTTSSRSNTKPVQKTAVVTSTSKDSSRGNSKPASKPASQSQSKKVEIRKVVYSSDDGDEIKNTFEFFDSNGDGKIDAREVRGAMQNIGYDETNPKIYEVITELDNPRNKNTGGVSFNDFCQTVNYRLPEKETEDELRRVFNLFLDDPNSDTTSLESIKRVADELGENIEEVELNAMLNKASKSGARLTFDDFVALMTGNNL